VWNDWKGVFMFQDLILLWKSYPANYRSGMQQFPDYARERVVPCRRRFLFLPTLCHYYLLLLSDPIRRKQVL
jgi:hypothetical protein